jgi:hypothetical protein
LIRGRVRCCRFREGLNDGGEIVIEDLAVPHEEDADGLGGRLALVIGLQAIDADEKGGGDGHDQEKCAAGSSHYGSPNTFMQ